MVNFYELFEINENADNEEINKAFRKKSHIYHPDKNGNSETSNTMFKMLLLAKETLLDPGKRLEHDYSVGIKNRPVAPPLVIKMTETKRETNVGQIIGWGLLWLIVGVALGSNGND